MATEYEVDRLVVRLVGDQVQYQKMLKDVERQTQESANFAERQGSRIYNAFSRAFSGAQSMLSSVGGGMQRMGGAAAIAGGAITAPAAKAASDFSEYGTGIRDIVRESEKASKEAEFLKKRTLEGTEAFKELNRVVKLTAEQASVFKMMSERTGVSLEVLTKTIRVGSDEFEVWRKEAEKFGLVIGKDTVKAADALSESWTRVKQSLSGAWTQAGSAVAKQFEEWNKMIVGIVTWITKWIEKNKELINTVTDITFKLTAVGLIVASIGTALSTVAALLGPIVAAAAAGAAAWLAWDTATGKFLRGGAAQAWEQYGAGVKSALNAVLTYGKQIIDYTNKIMTGVFDAIKAGNLELAVQILWSGAKVAWIKSMQEINKLTGDWFAAIFQNLAAGNWKNAAEAAFNEVTILWDKMLLSVLPILEKISFNARTTWTTIVNYLDEAYVGMLNILDKIYAAFANTANKILEKWSAVKVGGALGAAMVGAAGGGGISGIVGVLGNLPGTADTVEDNSAQRARELATRQAQRLTANANETVREVVALHKAEAAIKNEILKLEERRNELVRQGQQDAEKRMAAEQELLGIALKQAEAQKKLAETEQARAAKQRDLAEAERRRQTEALRLEERRKGFEDQFDPVKKYMEQLKELNAVFDESKRGTMLLSPSSPSAGC